MSRPTTEKWLEGMAAYLASHEPETTNSLFTVRPDEDEYSSIGDFVVPDEDEDEDDGGGAGSSKRRMTVYGGGGGGGGGGGRVGGGSDCPLIRSFANFVQLVACAFVDSSFSKSIQDDPESKFLLDAARKLRDALEVRKNSLVRSTVWSPAFTAMLETHPVVSSSSQVETKCACAACRVGTHDASYEIVLGGGVSGYDPLAWWMEPWSHNRARAIALRMISMPAQTTTTDGYVFGVGSQCHRRAMLFHRLHHFAFKLALRVRRKILLIAAEAGNVNINPHEGENTGVIKTRAFLLRSLLDSSAWFGVELQELTATIDAADAYAT